MQDNETLGTIKRIAFVGNYLPRQCGIATFTTDLAEAIADTYSNTTCITISVNDIEEGDAYLSRGRFEFAERDSESSHRAAGFLNVNNVTELFHRYKHNPTLTATDWTYPTSIVLVNGSLRAWLGRLEN